MQLTCSLFDTNETVLVRFPTNLWISLWGASAYKDPRSVNNAWSEDIACVAGTANRSFQSVSPSNWSVLINEAPDSSVVRSRIQSAGTR